MNLLGVFQILLSKYSGQEDIVIGSPIANRNYKEIEELIGFFINSLVILITFFREYWLTVIIDTLVIFIYIIFI